MSNSSPIRSKIFIDYPTVNKIFTPQLNCVEGLVSLRFSERMEIYSIDTGLKGDIRTRSLEYHVSSKGCKRIINSTVAVLFNSSRRVMSSNNETSIPLPTDIVLEYPFFFTFPVYKYDLPSSCDALGGETKTHNSNITIRYEFYVRILLKNLDDGTKEYFDLLVPLKFQGGTISIITDKDLITPLYLGIGDYYPIDSHVFKEKPKLYVPDYKHGSMISVKGYAAATKKLKKMIKSKRLSTAYRTVQKDVTLDLKVAIDELNLSTRLRDIPIEISCSSSLEPSEFSFSNMSTGLGHFEIQSLYVSIREYSRIPGLVSGFETPIIHHKYKRKPQFDIKNFNYNGQSKKYTWNSRLGDFMRNPGTIFDTLERPVLANMEVNDYVSTKVTLKVELVICAGDDGKNESATFQTFSPVSVECEFDPDDLSKIKKAKHTASAFHYGRKFSWNKSNTGTGSGINTIRKNYLDGGLGGCCDTILMYGGFKESIKETANYYQAGCYDAGDGYSNDGGNYGSVISQDNDYAEGKGNCFGFDQLLMRDPPEDDL